MACGPQMVLVLSYAEGSAIRVQVYKKKRDQDYPRHMARSPCIFATDTAPGLRLSSGSLPG